MCRLLILILIFTQSTWVLAASCDNLFQLLGRPNTLNHSPDIFREQNPGGGFLASVEGLYYASPSPEAAKPMLEEMGMGDVSPGTHSQLPGWAVYDVTDAPKLRKDLKGLQSKYSVYDGPRCYTAAAICTGWASGTYNAGSGEFKFWAKHLAKEIPLSEARPGDVFAVGEREPKDGVPVSHVATLVTPNIIFHKAAPLAEEPYEFLTREAFRSRYDGIYPVQKVYRQVGTMEEYVASHRSELPSELLETLEKLKGIEKDMDVFILSKRDNPRYPHNLPDEEGEVWAQAFHKAILDVREKMDPVEELAQKGMQSAPADSPTAILWEFVLKRSEELRTYPDPYD